MRNSIVNIPQHQTFSSPSGTTVIEGIGFHSDRCESQPITHGDHRTPNGWGYTVDDHWSWKAKTVVTNSDASVWYSTTDGYANNGCILFPRVEEMLADCREDALNQLVGEARGDLDLVTSGAEGASEGLDAARDRHNRPPTINSRTPRGATAHALAAWARFMEQLAGRGLRGRTRLAADIWLRLKYQWLPLLSDIYGAADEALRGNGQHRIITARRTRQIGEVIRRTEALHGALVPAYYAFNGKVSVEFKFNIIDPSFDLLRWGSLNPLYVGWNLVPASFVADWFVNIGDYLRAAETAIMYSGKVDYGYESHLVAYDVLGEATGTWEAWNGRFSVVDAMATRKIRQFSRIRLVSFPTPRLPTWNPHLGWQRFVSAGALTRGLFR